MRRYIYHAAVPLPGGVRRACASRFAGRNILDTREVRAKYASYYRAAAARGIPRAFRHKPNMRTLNLNDAAEWRHYSSLSAEKSPLGEKVDWKMRFARKFRDITFSDN